MKASSSLCWSGAGEGFAGVWLADAGKARPHVHSSANATLARDRERVTDASGGWLASSVDETGRDGFPVMLTKRRLNGHDNAHVCERPSALETSMKMSRFLAAAAAAAAALQWHAGAQQPVPQYRIQPLTDLTGAPALSLALRKLTTIGTVVHMTAHPDDENNAALALYARHVGARVALVTATRGDGGQNEIGTELFDALGVLRTEELLAAHRFDGAEQYFTRAVDFGYSFSQQETLEKWGHQEILGDFVRHIRTLRPDVIVSMSPDGTGGGQHHQTSAVLATEAFRAAADPAQFPEQMRDGLRPWQALKLYRPAGGFGGRIGRGGPPGGGAAAVQDPAADNAAVATACGATGRDVRHARHQRLRAASRLHDRRSRRRRLGHAHVPGPRADGRRRPAPTSRSLPPLRDDAAQAAAVGGDLALRRHRCVARRAWRAMPASVRRRRS